MADVILKDEKITVEVKDLNYIPAYKEYEEERQANEEIRKLNEETRIENEIAREQYIQELQERVDNGTFDGKNTVYVGSETPTEDYYNVWIDENGEESTIPTKTSDLVNDSSFTTTDYVDTAIQTAIGTALEGDY